MTDSVRVAGENGKGPSHEVQGTLQRDDGALIALARLIGEQCAAPAAAARQTEVPAGTQATAKGAIKPVLTGSPPPTTPTRPDQLRKPLETPNAAQFDAAYPRMLQKVQVDWELGQSDDAIDSLDAATKLGGVSQALGVHSATDPLAYRSLPGAAPSNPPKVDSFDVGGRFDVAWPQREAKSAFGLFPHQMKTVATIGMIAAAIAGFWGGLVIRSGQSVPVSAAISEPEETSALRRDSDRPIRVATTDRTGISPFVGSPLGSAPSLFPLNGPAASRPSQLATADNPPVAAAASSEAIAAVSPVPTPAAAASSEPITAVPPSPTPTAAASSEPIAAVSPAPTPAAAANPEVIAAVSPVPTPAASAAATSSASVSLPPPGPPHTADPVAPIPRHEQTPPPKSVSRAVTSDPHQREVHRAPKKRNPLNIVRLNDRPAIVSDPPSVANRVPGAVPQSHPTVAQPTVAQRADNQFFLTRWIDKFLGN
jgi:hypothetical protein